MGMVDRTREQFVRVARLRQAERRHPDDDDIASVRRELEHQLGSVLSRSMAARLLGVSHTALRRWVDAGDLVTVMDTDGRVGVPLLPLLDLYESMEAQRRIHPGRAHVLEQALAEGRRRALALDPRSLVRVGDEIEPHDRARLRSLAYHRALAQRLDRPAVDRARRQVSDWQHDGRIDPRYADAWDDVLRRPVREVARVLGDDSDAAADLRQNSPFAGTLSEPERRKILETIR